MGGGHDRNARGSQEESSGSNTGASDNKSDITDKGNSDDSDSEDSNRPEDFPSMDGKGRPPEVHI